MPGSIKSSTMEQAMPGGRLAYAGDASPCVAVSDNVESRSQLRAAPVEISVEVCAADGWHPATILNFSPEGFGLSGLTDLHVGDVISIAFEGDVSILCTVKWA